MHELSLCKNLIDIIEQQSFIHNYKKVKKVYLEIGNLSNIEKSAFLFSFYVASKNTILENAELEFIDILGSARCENCGRIVSVNNWFDSCVECESDRLTILTGDEFKIKSLEV